jgi:hypothetical protein
MRSFYTLTTRGITKEFPRNTSSILNLGDSIPKRFPNNSLELRTHFYSRGIFLLRRWNSQGILQEFHVERKKYTNGISINTLGEQNEN